MDFHNNTLIAHSQTEIQLEAVGKILYSPLKMGTRGGTWNHHGEFHALNDGDIPDLMAGLC